MSNIALLVVDVQSALVEANPYNKTELISNIKELLACSREQGIEVIYVRHDGGIGDELEYNTPGWEIYHEISPTPSETIIEKRFNSSFKMTNLKEVLDKQEIQRFILVGMQTEYCIDATCKVAFEYGYEVIIPEDTTTTYDNAFSTAKDLRSYYESKIWNNRYAKVIPVQQVIHDYIRK